MTQTTSSVHAEVASPIAAPLNELEQLDSPISSSEYPHPLLWISLVGSLLFHGGLSLFGTYRGTYDAYVHIFFADHWRRTWFDHWDPRWYTGFPLISYPPLSQQSVALLSFITDDLRVAFALVQTLSITIMALGMYRFARLWVDDESAGWAAMWLVFSTAMAETIHVFGQLPTTFSLGMLLNALPFAHNWVVKGRLRDLIKAWALVAATTGGHHVTTLFGAVFIVAPVLVLALVTRFRTPLPGEPEGHPGLVDRANWIALIARRFRRVLNPLIRAGIYGVGKITLLILVVFPYWYWSKTDPITQVSIPHASRDSFIVNPNAGLVFWLIPYGMLLFIFPYVFYRGLTTKAWPLTASIGLLALLGTGGTTPIPKLLLRGAFDILTLDRFTLWASVLMLPLAGYFAASLRHRGLAIWLTEQFGGVTWRFVQIFFVLGMISATIFTVSLTKFRKFQPDPIDPQPIVNFLEKDEHWRWRYLTLGFGDQVAWVSSRTTATMIDGNYHSARRLPELTTTPVERLEGAKFSGMPGLGSLQQFLAVPDKFNLKYIFSNDQFYDPLLFFYGWHRLQRLENGIIVWEHSSISPLPEILPRREIPLYQRWMFGILPVTALAMAFLTTTSPVWSIPIRLVFEFMGWHSLYHRLPKLRNTWVQRLWNKLDQRLQDISKLPNDASTALASWQIWFDYFVKFSLKRMQPANARARHVRTTLLFLCIVVCLATGFLLYRQGSNDPTQMIEAYYDDLDFRRFRNAYDRLNPQTRPSFDLYLLQLSVEGGLVASYSKLDDIELSVLKQGKNHMEVDVSARYVTALDYYTDTVTLQLSRLEGENWYIEPSPVDLTIPPEQFLRQPAISWFSQGRRRISADPTDQYADIIDQPQIQILSAHLIKTRTGNLSVAGELMNIAADPADVTLAAYLYDTNGKELVWYNATEVMMHKLLPQEITPFRVDFEGVAGLRVDELKTDLLSFNPNDVWFYRLPDKKKLGTFTLAAKSVVTEYDLNRTVGIQNLTVKDDEGRLLLQGELINNGTGEATIPHILVTLYDKDGEVVWVDHAYLREAIRPHRAKNFEIRLTPLDQLFLQLTPGYWPLADSETSARLKEEKMKSELIELPPGYGYRYLRVSVNYFSGSVQ